MLQLVLPRIEGWDEENEEFVTIAKEQKLTLEHSLVSLSKWESKWHKPFLTKDTKSVEETLDYIAKIDSDKVVTSLSAIGVMLGELSGTLFVITKVLSKNGSKGLIKAGASMVLIAAAVKVLADAMVKMADLSWEKIGKGLTAMGGGLLELSAAMKIINDEYRFELRCDNQIYGELG